MPYSIRFTNSGAEVRYSGVVTAAEVAASLDEVRRHDYPGGRHFMIVDLEAADLASLTGADVQALARQSPAPVGGPLPTAVIAPEDTAFGLGRMWVASIDERPVVARVLRTRAMALAWLSTRGIPDAELPADPEG